MTRHLVRGGWLALYLVGAAACSTTSSQQTDLMRSEGVTYISASELRVRVRALAPELAGIIEETSNEVLMAHGDDPIARQATRMWLTNAVPEMLRSLYHPDPLAGFVDAGAYVAQSTLFFAEGRGTELPDYLREAGLDACARLRQRMTQAILEVNPSSDTAEVWRLLDEWAREHPIDSSFAARYSTAQLFAEFTSRPGRGLQVVGQLGEQLDDFGSRIDLYAEYVPKLARWHGMLAAEEALSRYSVDDAFAGAAEIPGEIRRFAEMVPAERELILSTIVAESEVIRAWAHGERLATLAYLTDERVATLQELSAEREAVLAAIALEREAILAAAQAEREVVLEELTQMLRSAMVDAREEIIDHAFWRLAQLGAVGFVALALLVLATVVILKRR